MTLPGFAADWPAPAQVRTWQTVRAGGFSAGAYAALNLGDHVGDDPAAVARNRAAVTARLKLPAMPRWLEQVHGTRIVDLDAGETGPADGAFCRRRGSVAAIMTADCLPVLLCDCDGLEIAALHAGWRGLAAGVLEAGIGRLDAAPECLLAWLGPAIGPDAYEVGSEVRGAFVASDPGAEEAFRPNSRGRWQANLYALARRRLCAAGVTAVYGGTGCTFTESERYFSHRREAPSGRQATLIWLA